ncbi:MAG: response regulator [Candidatus Omnitrophota bacterium]
MEKRRILVVDDEEDICIFLKDILARVGFEVYTALSGQQAMEIFKKYKPHACIIDVHMPFSEYDGIEVLRRIKELDKKTNCVMITRIDDDEKITEAASLGAQEYLIKPVRLEKLKELAESLKADTPSKK